MKLTTYDLMMLATWLTLIALVAGFAFLFSKWVVLP
jgi:hypothetical protein